MAAYSYVIKGGTLIDGSGAPMSAGDVGISGEIIKIVGKVGSSGVARVIDAEGKYVIPGVIDITNHSDTHWTLFSAPSQESMLAQGITTVLGGLCGVSLAPLTDPKAIRAIQKWVDISDINFNWRSAEEFFQELSRHNLGVNFASLVGHGTLRRDITGDNPRELSPEELESMKLLLRRSIDEGAVGLSFGFASSHGRTVPQDEIIALAKVAAETDTLVSIHMRNEGRRLLSSVVEVINIARSSGARVEISHFKAIGRKAWHDFRKALTIIRKARDEENLSIHADFFPYLRTGSLLYGLLPEWILEGGKEKIINVLVDPVKKGTVLESIQNLTLHFDNIIIADANKDKHAVGKSLEQLAREVGLSPEETMIQLLITNDLGVTIFGKTLLSGNLVDLAREPFSMFGSDGVGETGGLLRNKMGLTHPRSFGAAARFLNRLARRTKILTWEEAVQKMTFLPAQAIGIHESRGLLKKGFFADVVIIDPETLEDTATYTDPYQIPRGVEHVFVNGHLTVEKGIFTGALAGKILRRQ